MNYRNRFATLLPRWWPQGQRNEDTRSAVVGGIAGVIAAYFAVGFFSADAGGAKLLVNSDVIGAAIGASLTIIGTLTVERIIRAKREGGRRHQVYLAGGMVRFTIKKMIEDRGPEVPKWHDKLSWQKGAFDRLLDGQPSSSAVDILCRIRFEDAWAAEYPALREISDNISLYEEAPQHHQIIEATERMTAALDDLLLLYRSPD